MPRKKASDLLRPIIVPLLEPPIEGDVDGSHGGIGRAHAERPLVVYLVNPKDGVGAGSVATLFWGNSSVAVASTIIHPGDENIDLIPLTVPSHLIVEYWINPVFGRLRRTSGNELRTEERKYRVSLTRPGGQDPDRELDGHQGLVYVIPPDVLLEGVSEERALAGIDITIRHWLHMRVYDLIILVWGSQQVLHRVQPGEVGRDITVTVDYATISAAGNNPLTRVAYQVRDAGGNLPDEWARWSAVSFIDVHLSEVRPAAPWLAFPDTGTVIDLAELGGWNAEIQIWVTNSEANAYSHVTLIWAGVDREGNSIPHTQTLELNRQGLYSFEIPNALVAAIAEGSASVHALYQKGTLERPSQKLYLDIIGEVVRWPAPTIDEDLGGHIEPDVEATVRFPLQGSWPANGYLEVIFRVSSADNTIEHRVGREVDDIEPTPEGDMLFTVYPNELRRFDGHLVEVFYAHTRPGNPPRPQESLRLQVIVGQIQRTMPAPIVDKAISGQLNPDDVGDYAKVFAPFTGTKRLDWIRMFWVGPRARTEVPVQVVVDGTTTEHNIENFYVTNNLHETVLVFYSLKRGEEMPQYSQITEVLISREVGELRSPTLLEAQVTGPNTADLEPLRVAQGTQLVVSYVGMRKLDSIKVTMTGAGNGGSPDIPAKFGNEALQKVEFDITRAAIHANIADRDTTVTFKYVVTRDGKPKTSDTLTVTVKPIPLAELFKTAIKLNQANATSKVLDLSAFTGAATAHIGIWPFITVPYPVLLRFLGKTSSNVSHDYLLYNPVSGAAVNQAWVNAGKIENPLPRTYLDGLGHGTKLIMEFKAAVSLSKLESEMISFPVVEYTVNTIQLPDEFPVPTLIQATGSGNSVTLAPMSATGGGTVRVQFLPMYTTDIITVTMVGTAGLGSPVIAEKNGLASGVVDFTIPATGIAANIGNANKTFTLKYTVKRNGQVRPSVVLTVTVTPIPVASLPWPLINGVAHNGTLDVPKLPADAKIRIATWPLQYSGMKIWLLYRCAGATPNPNVIWSGPQHHSAAGLEYGAPLAWLATCPDGGMLTVEFKVAYDPNANEAGAVSLPVTRYTVKNQSFRDFTDFENNSLNGWVLGSAGKEMYIRVASGANGQKVLFNNTSAQGDIHAGVVMSKNIPTVAGQQYIFSIVARRVDMSENYPIISLRTPGTIHQGQPVGLFFSTFSRAFVATQSSTAFTVYNERAHRDGNDFEVDTLEIKLA